MLMKSVHDYDDHLLPVRGKFRGPIQLIFDSDNMSLKALLTANKTLVLASTFVLQLK